MTKRWSDEPLGTRLYLEPHLWELARFISYGGKRPEDVKAFMEGHRQKHGESKAMWALHELTATNEKTGLTVLRLTAIKACRVLLGPLPDSPEYAEYWTRRGEAPPADHHPPKDPPPVEEAPPKRRTRKRRG